MLKNYLKKLPDSDKCLVVLSGGLDSTIALRLCIEKYGHENVYAISFLYGQRQSYELELASKTCRKLEVMHQIINLEFLRDVCQGYSCNVDKNMEMPTFEDLSKGKNPTTYIPNRNTIMLSICASFCEVHKIKYIVTGFQLSDFSGYWDTTKTYIKSLNKLLSENRDNKIEILAPFVNTSKQDELKLLIKMDGDLSLTENTISCYNATEDGVSCGNCPACKDRLYNFKELGIEDKINYMEK